MACRGHGGWRVREGPTAAVARRPHPTKVGFSARVSREADGLALILSFFVGGPGAAPPGLAAKCM